MDLWPLVDGPSPSGELSKPTIDLSDEDEDEDEDLEARINRDRSKVQAEQTTRASSNLGAAKVRKRIGE